ncbi:MAG TPA: sugar phosphate isomerase/epimerase family protein [Bryobacteraceae bacterium]|nr:sugar phosphate isomerase/epimerase family protein [Bryobacteraceae bacterium]
MPYPFRHAICNEVFEKWKFADTCKAIRQAGYSGIEIAPFTLAEDPAAITGAQRREYRAVMESEGLAFVGLHWLMVAPKGLHVTTPDKALREKSWLHVRHLVDLCAGLGPDGVMIFGSPKQRNALGGLSRAQATRHFVDGLAAIAPHAAERGVTILVEALPPKDTDVVTSLDEAAAIVREINHPAIRTMFDTHNAIAEVEPHASLVDRYFDLIRHLHVNEMDGRHPGTGDYDFKSVLKVFARRGYQQWVSLEVFDFSAGAEKIASDSLRFLQGEIKRLGV